MKNMSDPDYVPAYKRWEESRWFSYLSKFRRPLPEYRPSVLRDLRAGMEEIADYLFHPRWSKRFEGIFVIFIAGIAMSSFTCAFYA